MKKKLFPVPACALFALVCVSVSGCPVYDDDAAGCYDDFDCSVGYYCDYSSGACLRESAACDRPSACAANETCSKSGICAEGDCHFASVGCVSGFECSGASGRWECVRKGSSSGEGGGGGTAATGGGAPSSGGAAGSGGEAGAPEAGSQSGGAPAGGAGAAGN